MRRWLRRIGLGIAGLVVVLLLAGAGLYAYGRTKVNRTYDAPGALTSVPADPALVERGRHVMRIHGCQECHGADLSGQVFLDIPPGKIVAPNLTPGRGGVGGRYSVADFDRAVRHGVRPDGRSILPFMPFRLYNRLGDEDAAALIAYLKSLPPVDHELPPTELRVPGYLMVAVAGEEELRGDLDATRPPPPPAGPTADYGEYLASTICVECHGERLEGGKHPAPQAPDGPGLAHAGAWTFPMFAEAVRSGVAPGGRKLSEWMPSRFFAETTDVELQALHAYLKTLPPARPRDG